MFRCCKNENGFDVIMSPGIAEAPKQEYMSIRKIRDAIDGIPDLILVSAEGLHGDPVWDVVGVDHSRDVDYYVSTRDPSNLVVLKHPVEGDIWEYSLYVNYQPAGSGKTRKGAPNALLELANANPGMTINEKVPKLLWALQNIIDNR
jgi:hypothetical protein